MRTLGLVAGLQSLRALVEIVAAIGADNLDAIGHENPPRLIMRRNPYAADNRYSAITISALTMQAYVSGVAVTAFQGFPRKIVIRKG